MAPEPSAVLNSQSRWTMAAMLATVLIGAALRLVWVADMEWKGDEIWIYEHSRAVNAWVDLPGVGIPASVGITNPALSLWVFVGLSKLFAVSDPTGLARAVQICNIFALGMLVWFAYRFVEAEDREPWFWAAALVAVNPLAVLLERKIWPPSVLPLLTVILLCAWYCRGRRSGAFLWGLVAVCMGQIHMSGFFFGAGFALWAMLFDRRGVAWGAWAAGSALGGLTMIPWVLALAAAPAHASLSNVNWFHALEFKFWTRWVLEAFGFGIDYTLEDQFRDFLTYPHIFGRPSYLVAILHGVLVVAALMFLVRFIRSLWKRRGEWRTRLAGTESHSAFTQNAALWGYGLLLTASCAPILRHYMVILFPLEFLWVARVALSRRRPGSRGALRGRVALATLWTAQLLISVQFLNYIHIKQCIKGEYGATYASQQLAGRK